MFKLNLNKFWTKFNLLIIDEFDNLDLENEINNLFINYEKIFSRFKNDSELSILNKNKRAELSSLFFELFKKNIELNNLTNWFFNPFIDVESIWYSNKKLDLNYTKKNKILFNENFELKWNLLTLKNNSNLDFWWSWKWFFVDYVSLYLKNKGFKNYFIDFWGDVYVSWRKNKDDIWRIWIENPFLIWETIGYINLTDSSISSSGNYFRNWDINWKQFHHIINPLNNLNENEIKMITIISKNTYFSDSIATALFNMWIKNAILFLNKNNIDWLIIWMNAKAYFSKWFIKKYWFKKEY